MNIIAGTDGRVYEADLDGRAFLLGRGTVEHFERLQAEDFALQQASELRAEFASSWATGGGDPADASAAWSQFGRARYLSYDADEYRRRGRGAEPTGTRHNRHWANND